MPADVLRNRGKVVDYVHWTTIANASIKTAMAYDVFVLARSGFANSTMSNLMLMHGKKFILEVDDDFTNEYREVIGSAHHDAVWNYAHNIANSVICSTKYLADLMHSRTGKKTYVCPNSVLPNVWRVPKRERLTIGLTGSATHAGDWEVLEEVIPEILAKYPHVDFLLGGYMPDYFKTLMEKLPQRVIWHEWLPFKDYPTVAGSVHITLCPVNPEDKFNLSKSGLKAIEGMASGAAIIATDMNIYQEVIDHGRTGLLVEQTPEAWLNGLCLLIEDQDLRLSFATRGKRYVNKHHNIFVNADLWWQAFRETGA